MAIPEQPFTRIEMYLAKIAGDDVVVPEQPYTRIEMYLAKIAGDDTQIPSVPYTRIEMYLAKIAGQNVGIPEKPLTRKEMFLAVLAGQDEDTPEPITREECYLAQWIDSQSTDVMIRFRNHVMTITNVPAITTISYLNHVLSMT